MKRRLLPLLFGLLVLATVQRAAAQVAIIVNPNVTVNSITKTELRDIFTGASTSLRNGAQVTPVLLRQGGCRTSFSVSISGRPTAGFAPAGGAFSSAARARCQRRWIRRPQWWSMYHTPLARSGTSGEQHRMKGSRFWL